MLPAEREAEVLRLFHAEHWKVGTIATQLCLHHSTVRRVLTQAGVVTGTTARPSIVDPFLPLIVDTLTKFPKLTASRVYEMARARGFTGSADHFRAVVARHRPRRAAEAFARLRTLPGEQAQIDWGHFGTFVVGKAPRKLMAFVMTLSWSRKIFLRFYLGSSMAMFLRGHVEAFEAFGGVAREGLYDNLKSLVLERVGDAIRFHPTLLAFAGHYRCAVRPCRPARGNEKGRVERSIRYIRDSFFAARSWVDLADLNTQADAWCAGISADRLCPEDRTRTVREAFEDERASLLALPDNPYPTEECETVSVGKTPYARFDLNDYSVPHTLVRRSLVVRATMERVRVLDGETVLASHARSWDRGQQIEDPAHVAALTEHKREAGTHRGQDRLPRAVPLTTTLLEALAARGGNVGNTVSRLLSLLDVEGPEALGVAMAQALAQGTVHAGAVRLLLETARKARGVPPPLPVELPADPRVRDLVVRPHPLAQYDHLGPTEDDDER